MGAGSAFLQRHLLESKENIVLGSLDIALDVGQGRELGDQMVLRRNTTKFEHNMEAAVTPQGEQHTDHVANLPQKGLVAVINFKGQLLLGSKELDLLLDFLKLLWI